jgi:hypothetical protein
MILAVKLHHGMRRFAYAPNANVADLALVLDI